MEYDPKDNEVIHLLKKLKESNGAYPPEMLASRRQGYLKQVAEVSAGIGMAAGLRNALKGGSKAAGSISPTAGTVVEALLVIAIVAETGAVTYFYRDKIAAALRSITNQPRVEEIASPPVLASPVTELQFTSTPVFTETAVVTETGTETLTLTPEGTPSPELAAQATQQNGGGSVNTTSSGTNNGGTTGGPSVSSSQPANGNNGNHYGQTPQPVRTKDPNANTSSSTQQPTTNTKKKP